MRRDTGHAMDLLKQLDPAAHLGAGSDAPPSLAAIRAAARAGEDCAESAGRPRSMARRRVLAGSVVLAGSTAVALLFSMGVVRMPGESGGAGQAYAATPAPLEYHQLPGSTSLKEVLNRLAERVQSLPDDSGAGPYAYVRIRSWSLFTRIDHSTVTSRVVPQVVERWISQAGAGRILTVSDPVSAGAAHESQDETFSAGQLSAPAPAPSADPAVLREQLLQGHPAANGPHELLVAVWDLASSRPLAPDVRAALLRVLADAPGLTLEGTVTDRAGRTGIAISATTTRGLPIRWTLVFDQASGALLDQEQLLTVDAGKLNVRVPAVIGYSLLMATKQVGSVRDR